MHTYEKNLTDALSGDDPAGQIRAIQLACRHRREDLLHPLIALLSSDEVGSFVEECLPQFGEKAHQPLRALIGDLHTSTLARRRAAGIIALLGDRDAVPILLEAIEDPDVNQAYLRRLIDLAPDALARRIVLIVGERRTEILTTLDPHLASYFAALLRSLGALEARHEAWEWLLSFQRDGQDWRIQKAAGEALAAD